MFCEDFCRTNMFHVFKIFENRLRPVRDSLRPMHDSFETSLRVESQNSRELSHISESVA